MKETETEFVNMIKKIRKENKNKKRIVYLPAGEQYENGTVREYSTIIIIFTESFSLWYLLEDGRWIYDGWEIGDYRSQWLDRTI